MRKLLAILAILLAPAVCGAAINTVITNDAEANTCAHDLQLFLEGTEPTLNAETLDTIAVIGKGVEGFSALPPFKQTLILPQALNNIEKAITALRTYNATDYSALAFHTKERLDDLRQTWTKQLNQRLGQQRVQHTVAKARLQNKSTIKANNNQLSTATVVPHHAPTPSTPQALADARHVGIPAVLLAQMKKTKCSGNETTQSTITSLNKTLSSMTLDNVKQEAALGTITEDPREKVSRPEASDLDQFLVRAYNVRQKYENESDNVTLNNQEICTILNIPQKFNDTIPSLRRPVAEKLEYYNQLIDASTNYRNSFSTTNELSKKLNRFGAKRQFPTTIEQMRELMLWIRTHASACALKLSTLAPLASRSSLSTTHKFVDDIESKDNSVLPPLPTNELDADLPQLELL